MAPLRTSNVFSIGPLEGGGAEDDDGGGLKAGVAPGNDMTQNTGEVKPVSIFTGFWRLLVRYRAPPSFEPGSQETRPGRSLAAAGDLEQAEDAMRTAPQRLAERSPPTWRHGVRIKVLDSLLLQHVFVHQKPACVVLGLGQDGVGGVCHDVGRTTLFPNTLSAQHVHCCRLDCYGNREEEEGEKSSNLGNLGSLSLTGSRPEGVDGDLTSELFRHAQDAHRHAVFCHRVCWKQTQGGGHLTPEYDG